MSDKPELKPCRHCCDGGNVAVRVWVGTFDNTIRAAASCDRCGARGPWVVMRGEMEMSALSDGAARQWNQWAEPTTPE